MRRLADDVSLDPNPAFSIVDRWVRSASFRRFRKFVLGVPERTFEGETVTKRIRSTLLRSRRASPVSDPSLTWYFLYCTIITYRRSTSGRIVADHGRQGYNPAATEPAAMSDEPIEAAVERFLDETESTLDSYDQGYADADATITVLRTHIDELAAAVDDDETE